LTAAAAARQTVRVFKTKQRDGSETMRQANLQRFALAWR
jgi:hypothetical protein